MLTELRIENFAIIQHLELQLGSGLVTFTGETGAGKSILLDAIVALLGGRVENTLLRSGADRAIVEATFRIPEGSRLAVTSLLEEQELLDDPQFLTLGRELRKDGRNIPRVNGRTVNVSLLKELGSYLVDIHGQSEHLSLLNVRQHLGLLDRFAHTENLLEDYGQEYKKLQALRRELKELRQSEQDATRQLELLQFQIGEIETAHLKPGEDIVLKVERDRLANAENLAANIRKSLVILDEGTPESPAINDMLGEVAQMVSALERMDSSQAELNEQAQGLVEGLNDLIRGLRRYEDGIEFNPRRLEEVEERLDLIHKLARKYGGTIESVVAYGNEAAQKMDRITHAGERIEELETLEQKQLEFLARLAADLSIERRKASEKLGQGVENELVDLNMKGARFSLEQHSLPADDGLPMNGVGRVAFDATGIDRVEFMIAPNPGEGFKPLVKIASGGETSRLMLALKNTLARADNIPTLIFDEIDQGIGGRVGSTVGEKLWLLGRQHQVLCVTHLPQLAAFGDQQLRVQKRLIDGRTVTEVENLEGDERLDELALMIGGVSEVNRQAAREALDQAGERRQKLLML
jgi:DNA repair protein RecN (Recombination protein N)